ncbi:hypothetical protein EAF00_004506 [Botryotinia globosa]|nr:hypothetical protein EAF00_004506 [Botryotinia globosa]
MLWADPKYIIESSTHEASRSSFSVMQETSGGPWLTSSEAQTVHLNMAETRFMQKLTHMEEVLEGIYLDDDRGSEA